MSKAKPAYVDTGHHYLPDLLAERDRARLAEAAPILAAVAAAVAAQDAEAAAKAAWHAARAAYRGRYPSPPRRRGWKAYEDHSRATDRATKREVDAYDAAREATKRATAAIFDAARAGGGQQ